MVGGVYLQREAVQHAQQSLDASLSNTAGVEANALDAYFERAASIGSLVAGAPEFRRFYELPGSRADKARSDAERPRRRGETA